MGHYGETPTMNVLRWPSNRNRVRAGLAGPIRRMGNSYHATIASDASLKASPGRGQSHGTS